MTEPLIRNISDTARWVAFYRARESERADALFRDPFGRRLAGARGEEIAAAMPSRERDNRRVTQTLKDLEAAARGSQNTMPCILDAVRAYATVGEICDTLRSVFGTYERSRDYIVETTDEHR